MGHIFSRSLSSSQAILLDRGVSDEEILVTLKSMRKNKSPGPDGFNVNFFVSNWDIVGEDFLAAVKSFFEQGCLLKAANATAIALSQRFLILLLWGTLDPFHAATLLTSVYPRLLLTD